MGQDKEFMAAPTVEAKLYIIVCKLTDLETDVKQISNIVSGNGTGKGIVFELIRVGERLHTLETGLTDIHRKMNEPVNKSEQVKTPYEMITRVANKSPWLVIILVILYLWFRSDKNLEKLNQLEKLRPAASSLVERIHE